VAAVYLIASRTPPGQVTKEQIERVIKNHGGSLGTRVEQHGHLTYLSPPNHFRLPFCQKMTLNHPKWYQNGGLGG